MYHPITRTLGLDDATVAVSETVEREHTGDLHRFPEIGGQWTTIHNTVAVDEIHSSATGSTIRDELGLDNELLFVNMGRYVPSKDQTELIRAMKTVADTHPVTHLAIVGWGPEKERLQDRAVELGVEDYIIITGRVPDVEPYLGAGDGFVLSSRAESLAWLVLRARDEIALLRL